MKKYIGKIFWISGYYEIEIDGSSLSADITRAIYSENTFRIEHSKTNDFSSGLIRLKTENGFLFSGSMKYIDEAKSAATVNLEFYDNSVNSMFIGKWNEDNVLFTCIIKLQEVDNFEK
ncbi:hypothetical protein [Xanthomarina sp.]|uniref:hypothetical protein n=2 Tax=Flavobacteriaceae TaxID=49546 RepID=UPI00257F1DBA|nr:hypothetical protein [Xanthomarina sp.]